MIQPRRICSYISPDGTYPVEDFINRQDAKMRKKILFQLRQLQKSQFQLQPPTVKAFRLARYRGLYELRTRIRQMVRIIFFVNSDGDIILLHGFTKKCDRATEQALETARERKRSLASGAAQAQEIIIL